MDSTTPRESVTSRLARFAIETNPAFLDAALIEAAKLKFLDTLGITVRGANEPAAQAALRVARHSGGRAAATILGSGERTSAESAAFVNGVSAHALEYDDNTQQVGHVSVCLVPGCLAAAEEAGANGRKLLEAFALGFEITSRVAKGLRPYLIDNGWHPIGIVGGQGVAVAASRLFGLDTLKTRMAMGIMASSGSGVRKNVGSMGKAFHVGHGVRAGVFSALLAREGFVVDPDIIEGAEGSTDGHPRFGLADTFNGVGRYRLHLMVEGLGQEPLELARNTTMVRMHPGSTAPGASIDGMIAIAKAANRKPDDVEEIVLECTPQCYAIAPYDDASNEHRAKFCLPYIMAVAFADRAVGIDQYGEARRTDPQVLALMKRVTVVQPEDLAHHRGQWGEGGVNWGEARLTVRFKDGEVVKQACSHAKGWPEDPARWEDLEEKFMQCAQGVLGAGQAREAVDMIAKLETLDRVGDLAAALCAR
ncbi:MAG TPA: MmgE/PrpD family protein [Burkholderiales bacterium]|nr:MmgE/PrpD family protein [Burkholderiales bacterium]